jgi:predicted secreted protein with PEFG-CTERM motif
MNTKIAVAVGLAAVLAAVFAIPQTAFAADVNVDITPGSSTKTTDAFSPFPVQANVGDRVIWTNKDSTLHTVLSGTPSGGSTGMFGGTAEAPILVNPGKTMEFTFTEAGEFDYYCNLHPSMVGKVIVAGGAMGGPFEVTASIGGNDYKITGESETVKATAATIEAGTAVKVTFDKAGDVELTLPKAMIDGIPDTGGVTAGDSQVVYTKTDGADSTTLAFTVPEGGTTVSITGTTVIPEFPLIAALILGASIAGIIGYTRIARGKTAGFFGRV